MTAISANGITIEYETRGQSSDPALILIRGLGTQLINWPENLLQRLVAAGFFMIVFDNRDAGLSTKFEAAGAMDVPDLMRRAEAGEDIEVPYLLEDMAADVIGLMDALRIETAHVAGISMGGAIAQVLAAKHGHRLRSMASIMAQSGNPDTPPGSPEAMATLMRAGADESTREGAIKANIETARVLASPLYPTSDEDRRVMAVRSYERCHCPDGRTRQRAAIIKNGNRVPMLRGITIPCQVIHGIDDPLLNIAGGQDTAANIPGADFHAIAGLGHETPAALSPVLADLIGCFAKRVDEAGGEVA
ncbi:MAG: alpha/beta hydrolase [Alphaproteobacteria bacterium]|jgi:pimeloyl-ACP methyl ester carboxylesterase|nr:alpha/beta hydrolase [Alphaproteobacteria bacterium]